LSLIGGTVAGAAAVAAIVVVAPIASSAVVITSAIARQERLSVARIRMHLASLPDSIIDRAGTLVPRHIGMARRLKTCNPASVHIQPLRSRPHQGGRRE
jgi:hypothetical protein